MEFCRYLHICHLVPDTDLEILHTYSRSYFRTGPYFYLDFIQARIYGHLVSKESPGSAGDPDLIPRLGRSSGEGNGNPLEYPCLEIPWTEEPGRLQSMGLQRVGHDWATSLSLFTFMHWRRKLQPTPVFLPGESRGNLVGFCLWGRTESDMTEVI